MQRAAILPGAALVYAISRKLTERLGAGKSVELRELTFHRPVDHIDVQIRVLETKGCCEAFCPASSYAAVASCEYSFTPRQSVPPMSPPRMIHGFSEHFYDQMLQRGYGYGKTFQVVLHVRCAFCVSHPPSL